MVDEHNPTNAPRKLEEFLENIEEEMGRNRERETKVKKKRKGM